jgi:sodium/hydrogen antiporter
MGWTLAIVAGVLVAYALVSGRLDGSPVTSPMVFVGAGLLLGDGVLDQVDLPAGGSLTAGLAETTLALVLFTDASRIDLRSLRAEVAVPVRLLGIGLPLTIAAGALASVAVFGDLLPAEALVLAVVLAPTDAALGQAVVTDPRLPSRIRQGLNVESGLNDGICVPLLFVALALAESEAHTLTGTAAATLLVEELGYGLVGGLAAGGAVALLVNAADRRSMIDPAWTQVAPVAGAALAYGLAAPLGGSGFIAAFAGGLVFGWLRHEGGVDDRYLLEESGGLLTGVTFFVFGAVALGPALGATTWQIAVYGVLSLTVIRIVPVALSMVGTGARAWTVMFLGWFGPRGLASIVFAAIVVEEADLPHASTIVATIVVTVGLSVLVHGLTAAPFARRYANWFAAHPRDRRPEMESVEVPVSRWRRSAVRSGPHDP